MGAHLPNRRLSQFVDGIDRKRTPSEEGSRIDNGRNGSLAIVRRSGLRPASRFYADVGLRVRPGRPRMPAMSVVGTFRSRQRWKRARRSAATLQGVSAASGTALNVEPEAGAAALTGRATDGANAAVASVPWCSALRCRYRLALPLLVALLRADQKRMDAAFAGRPDFCCPGKTGISSILSDRRAIAARVGNSKTYRSGRFFSSGAFLVPIVPIGSFS